MAYTRRFALSHIHVKASLSLEDLANQFDAFVSEAHRLKELYAQDITLLVGLETEYISPLDLDNLDTLLQKYAGRIEYLVGSLHHVNGIPIDFDLETYKKALGSITPADTGHQPMEVFLCSYFDAQHEIMQRLHPEIIGHIDLCRLYEPTLSLESYPQAWAKLERNVRFAIEYGALFELNAAALRKGWTSSYPGEDVVKVSSSHSSFTTQIVITCLSSFGNMTDGSPCRTTVTAPKQLGRTIRG